MSETNIQNSHLEHPKSNNTIYYNHSLHFKHGSSIGQYPFLQGLMSNELFPIWLRNDSESYPPDQDSANNSLTTSSDVKSNDVVLNPAHESTQPDEESIKIVNVELDPPAVSNELSLYDDESHHATDSITESSNTAEIKDFIEMELAQNEEDNEKIIEATNEILPFEDSPSHFVELNDVVNIANEEEKPPIFESEGKAIEFIENEDSPMSISDISAEIAELEAKEIKKPSLKQSQKKILKKNILFFKELPELNSFNKWLIQQKPMEDGSLIKLLKLRKKAKKEDKKRKLNEGIQASVQKNDKLVSEVLAKILASQGHYLEAIEMYRQLILNIPDKSATFAAQIDELNKKII